jgi:hypothetical protein
MNNRKKWKILQIVPAQDGWKAVHCGESEDNEIKIFNRAVICWALVESVEESAVVQTQVRGIEQGTVDLVVVDDLVNTEKAGEDEPDRNQYFLGYNDPEAHKESDYWMEQGHDRFRTEKAKRLEEKALRVAS